jgi:hypothetical protein
MEEIVHWGASWLLTLQNFSGWSNHEECYGILYGICGEKERCVPGLGGKTWRKSILGRPRCRWEINIKKP